MTVTKFKFPTSDEDSSTPDQLAYAAEELTAVEFPTSDEDSSTPDTQTVTPTETPTISFRPLTRIHLLLT